MPVAWDQFEPVTEDKAGESKVQWDQFEPVAADPKALALGVQQSINLPLQLSSTLQAGALAKYAGDKQREKELRQSMGRIGGMMGDPGAAAGLEPDVELKATKDILTKPVEYGFEKAHEALAPALSDFLRTSGVDPSSTPEHIINLGKLTGEQVKRAGEAGRGSTSLIGQGLSLAMRHAPELVAGLGNLQTSTVESFAQPEQAALLLASGGESAVGRAASLLFASDQFASLPAQIREAINTIRDPNVSTADKVEAMGRPGIGVLFGAMMAKHGFTPGPSPMPLTATDRGLMAAAAGQTPPMGGIHLQMPRGAPAPRLEIPGIERATPEEAAARAEQMTREATASFGPRGLPQPMAPQAPRLEIPEGASDPRVNEIRQKGLRDINQILAAFPDTLKGNREAARALRNDAFPEFRKDQSAEGIRSDQRQPDQTGQAAVSGEADRGGDLQQAPPGESQPVGAGEKGKTADEAQAIEKADEDFFQQKLGEIQGRAAKTINDEIVKTVQEKGWAGLDESDRRYLTPEQKAAYKAWVDAGRPEDGGKAPPPEEPPPAEPTAPPPTTPPTAPAAGGEARTLTQSERDFGESLAKKYGSPVAPTVPAAEPHESVSRFRDMLERAADKSKDEAELDQILAAAKGLPDESRIAWAVANNPHATAETFARAKANTALRGMTTDENIASLDSRRAELRKQRGIEPNAPAAPETPEARLERIRKEADAAKAEQLKQVGERIKSGDLKPENIRVSVNPVPESPEGGYVQVDEATAAEGNKWSSNPDALRKLGLDIPSQAELLKLPQGQYTLEQVRQMTKAAGETKPAAPKIEDRRGTYLRDFKAGDVVERNGKRETISSQKRKSSIVAGGVEISHSADVGGWKKIEPEPSTPKTVETTPAASTTEAPTDVESLLKAEVPDVTEARTRVKAIDSRRNELSKERDALDPKLKELEKKVTYQVGPRYQRGRVKPSAPRAALTEYRAIQARQLELSKQIQTLDETAKADRDVIDKAVDAEIVSDKKQPLLRRLDRAARMTGGKPSPELLKALRGESARLLREKYPDITPEEIARISPEIERSAYHGGNFMNDPQNPTPQGLRQAALAAKVNAPDVSFNDLPEDLQREINKHNAGHRTYGGPVDMNAPLEPLTPQKVEALKAHIDKAMVEARARRAAEEKAAAKEKAEEEAKSAQLMQEAQAQADSAVRTGKPGGRSAEAVRDDLQKRIQSAVKELSEKNQTTLVVNEDGSLTAQSQTGGGIAFGTIEDTGSKTGTVRVTVRTPGGQAFSGVVADRFEAQMVIKGMASEGSGHVIIGVPGDGVFRLVKSGPTLLKLWQDAGNIDTHAGYKTNRYKAQGGAENAPQEIKTLKNWEEAKDYHGLTATDRIHDWSPALREIAKKVNPKSPETVTVADVDAKIKEKDAIPKAAEPAAPSAAEKVVSALESAADKARARLRSQEQSGVGGELGLGTFLTKLPNAIDYATIGAAKLARYGLDKATWAAEMIREFGKRISPHLDTLFEDSKMLLARHGEIQKAKDTPVQEIIDQASGAATAPKDTIRQIIDTLQSGLKTVRALKDHFTDAPQVSRAEVKLADDFLEADANRIKESLTDLVKRELPPSERGIFITAINNATRRSPILTGDPEAMYRRAAEVAGRIEERGIEVQKKTAISDIKANVTKALASPTVDLVFKSKIGDLVKEFTFTKPTEQTLARLKTLRDYVDRQTALGKDTAIPKAVLDTLDLLNKVPIKELPLHVLEALRDRIALLEEMGRRTVATRELRWENEKAIKNRELDLEPTNPLNKRPEFTKGLTEGVSPLQAIGNLIKRRQDGVTLMDKALLPIDPMLDLLGDGKAEYRGWLFKHVRNPLDLGFNTAKVMSERITKPLTDIIRNNGLDEKNARRIGVYAALKQEGGRERLMAMGATKAELDNIEKNLSSAEKQAYTSMREALDRLLPPVQKLMHELYNIPVEPVENYFPMPRDWKKVEVEPKTPKEPKFGEEIAFDDLGAWNDLSGDYTQRTTKEERGSTISRLKGAKTAIKINAFEVFQQHINDVAHLLSTQRDIKMIGELAKSERFAKKYGELGRNLVLDFVDTFARQGRMTGLHRWDVLDTLRKNTSVGVIGARIASQFVHASNIPLGMERAGPINYSSGLMESVTPEGQQFLKDNFAETFARGGGEPALVEAQEEGGGSVFGKQIVPKKWIKYGFAIARFIDQKNAQATVLGVYFKELAAKGKDPAQYLTMPVDKEAQAHALVLTRRAVASPLPKDVSMVLSRGALTGGNVSIGRAMFQFQNIMLDQWSNMRYDLPAYLRNDRVKAARIVFALTAMVLGETLIRETSKEAIKGLTGYKPKKEPSLVGQIGTELLRRFPFAGQLMTLAMRPGAGIPIIDTTKDIATGAYQAVTAKKAKAQDRGAIRAVSGTAQLLGVPGASQVGELIEKSQ